MANLFIESVISYTFLTKMKILSCGWICMALVEKQTWNVLLLQPVSQYTVYCLSLVFVFFGNLFSGILINLQCTNSNFALFDISCKRSECNLSVTCLLIIFSTWVKTHFQPQGLAVCFRGNRISMKMMCLGLRCCIIDEEQRFISI